MPGSTWSSIMKYCNPCLRTPVTYVPGLYTPFSKGENASHAFGILRSSCLSGVVFWRSRKHPRQSHLLIPSLEKGGLGWIYSFAVCLACLAKSRNIRDTESLSKDVIPGLTRNLIFYPESCIMHHSRPPTSESPPSSRSIRASRARPWGCLYHPQIA